MKYFSGLTEGRPKHKFISVWKRIIYKLRQKRKQRLYICMKKRMDLNGFLGNSLLIFQEHKVLLTGTPLQNTVEELFSLLHFLEPGRFPSETTFMQEFGDLKTEEQVNCPCILSSLFRYREFNHFIVSELYDLFLQVIPVFFLDDRSGLILVFVLLGFILSSFCFRSKFILTCNCSCCFDNWSYRNELSFWVSVSE